jgi:hypothetical protein
LKNQSVTHWKAKIKMKYRRVTNPPRISRFDIVTTFDFKRLTDLQGAVSVVSDVLTISQQLEKGLGDTSSRIGGSLIPSGYDSLGVGVDDHELTVEAHWSLLGGMTRLYLII